jgi:hypothetical protein
VSAYITDTNTNRAIMDTTEPLHDSLRYNIGQAISDAMQGGAETPDWCDSREIDRLADAVMLVLPAAREAVDIDSIALEAATKLMGIRWAGPRQIGRATQIKAQMQCVVRDALAAYRPAPTGDPVGQFLRVKDAFGEIYLHVRGEEDHAAIDLFAAPVIVAAPAIPDELRRIGELIRTQDSDYTANAVFVVEQERILTCIDTDYDPEIVWCIEDSQIFKGDGKFDALEAAYDADGTVPENYTRTGCSRHWDYLTQFFTRASADAYIERHGHKLDGKLRVMIEGDHRNTEFNFVRDWLAGLPKEDAQA